jgi:hypothetical protein
MDPITDTSQCDGNPFSRRAIVLWWETRRIRYNLMVGLSGISSIVLILVAGSAAVKPGADFEEPIGLVFGPIVFGIMANVCYTTGWIVDISVYGAAPRYSLFRLGLMLSIVFAGLPGLWAVIAWLITLCTGHKLD